MNLLEKEKIATATPRALVAPRPIAKPTIRVRARVVSYPAARRAARGGQIVGRLTLFFGLVGLTYVSSTLGGYVMLERARQQGRHGEERAAYARREASAARESIEALTNPAALRVWANGHGFVAGGTKSSPVAIPGDSRLAIR